MARSLRYLLSALRKKERGLCHGPLSLWDLADYTAEEASKILLLLRLRFRWHNDLQVAGIQLMH